MLLLHIGMGHSWRARRCVVLGYGGLMEEESNGSGLLETDITPVTLEIDRCSEQKEQLGPAAKSGLVLPPPSMRSYTHYSLAAPRKVARTVE